jgi:hypothetical protein
MYVRAQFGMGQANVQPGYTFDASTGNWVVTGTNTLASSVPPATVPYQANPQGVQAESNFNSSDTAYFNAINSIASSLPTPSSQMGGDPTQIWAAIQSAVTANPSLAVALFGTSTVPSQPVVSAIGFIQQAQTSGPITPAVSSGVPAGGAPLPVATYDAAKEAEVAGSMTSAQLAAGMNAGNLFWNGSAWQPFTGYYDPETGSSAPPASADLSMQSAAAPASSNLQVLYAPPVQAPSGAAADSSGASSLVSTAESDLSSFFAGLLPASSSSGSTAGVESTASSFLDSIGSWISANPILAVGGGLALMFMFGGGGKR